MAAGFSKLILLSTAAAAGGGIAASNFGFSSSGEKETPKNINKPEEKKKVTPEPEETGKCFIFVTDEAQGSDKKITKILQKYENKDTFLQGKREGNSSGFSQEVEDACGDKKKNVKSGKDTHVYVYQDSNQKWIYSQYAQKDWVNTTGIDTSKIEVKS